MIFNRTLFVERNWNKAEKRARNRKTSFQAEMRFKSDEEIWNTPNKIIINKYWMGRSRMKRNKSICGFLKMRIAMRKNAMTGNKNRTLSSSSVIPMTRIVWRTTRAPM
jgi:hypothetical protein